MARSRKEIDIRYLNYLLRASSNLRFMFCIASLPETCNPIEGRKSRGIPAKTSSDPSITDNNKGANQSPRKTQPSFSNGKNLRNHQFFTSTITTGHVGHFCFTSGPSTSFLRPNWDNPIWNSPSPVNSFFNIIGGLILSIVNVEGLMLGRRHRRRMWRRFTFTGSSSFSTFKSRVSSYSIAERRKMSTGMRFRLYAFLLISIAALPIIQSREQLSTRECESLGFTGIALCSDCNTLAEYVKDQGSLVLLLCSVRILVSLCSTSFWLQKRLIFWQVAVDSPPGDVY